MTSTSNMTRISEIKEAPVSWKERDLLTAAERYMAGAIEFPLVEFALPCFPEMGDGMAIKFAQVWRCVSAAFHLQKAIGNKDGFSIQLKAARIYEQEAQRILGSVFPLENGFWKAFYARQEVEETKPLVAIDALYFGTGCREQISYQLLLQSLKAILTGHYKTGAAKKEHFGNAGRLIIDLPMGPLREWLNEQVIEQQNQYPDNPE